jgi:selenium metabolism protein YedF
MIRIDLRGKQCPVPVIETKQFLENNDVREIEIILDNQAACENVTRFLGTRNFTVAAEKIESNDTFQLRAVRLNAEGEAVAKAEKKVLVFMNSETLGRGDDELGRVLTRSFLYTLKVLEVVPWRIIFMNGGVKHVAEGSESLVVLKEIGDLGVEILACGTCLDYFHIKDMVRVGRISNMYEIASSFLEATQVISP